MSESDIELSDDENIPPNLEHITTVEQAARTLADLHTTSPESSTSSEDSSIHPRTSLQTLRTMTDTETTYVINGVVIQVAKTEVARASDTLYTKAARKEYDDKERNELIEKIQKNQQEPYKSITISVNDPERMTNTHSIAQLLAENKRNLVKYDLHDVFLIVHPKPGAFDPTSSDYRLLETTVTGDKTTPITQDLFSDYLRLTVKQVALSSKWYSKFVPESEKMQENLTWSLAYYEKNVERSLYSKVHSQLLQHPIDSRGGPLFLKLLLDRVSTTNEANLKAIIHITETYQIKRSCAGEDIETVVSLFRALYDNMASLKQGQLPEDAVKNLLQIFRTTSVPRFNDLFEKMEIERLNNEIRGSVDHQFATTHDDTALGNNMTSVDFILKYAERVYRTFVQKGIWDDVLQRPAGQSAFLGEATTSDMGPNQFQQPNQHQIVPHQQTLPPIQEWTKPGDCFNCGNPNCRVRTCRHPKDPLRIRKNKEKHPRFSRERGTNNKFRLPEPHENNKRVIDGKPHTFDPTSGSTGRWIADETPSDGQPNNGQPPRTQFTQIGGNSTRSSTTGTTSSLSTNSGTTTDRIERRLNLQLQMANLQAEYESLAE